MRSTIEEREPGGNISFRILASVKTDITPVQQYRYLNTINHCYKTPLINIKISRWSARNWGWLRGSAMEWGLGVPAGVESDRYFTSLDRVSLWHSDTQCQTRLRAPATDGTAGHGSSSRHARARCHDDCSSRGKETFNASILGTTHLLGISVRPHSRYDASVWPPLL